MHEGPLYAACPQRSRYNLLLPQPRSPAAASAILKRIGDRIDRLADFSLMAPVTELPGIHGLSIVRYPYKAYYRIMDDEVVILHVRDARRTPWAGEN